MPNVLRAAGVGSIAIGEVVKECLESCLNGFEEIFYFLEVDLCGALIALPIT